nr:biotin/lipoyl-containing protein [uncultured Draconibacterium sp.]
MAKSKIQKYIVTGEKRYRFSTVDFLVKKSKKRRIGQVDSGNYKVSIDNVWFEGNVVGKKQNKYKVLLNGNTYSFTIDREKTHARKAMLAENEPQSLLIQLKSPMPGKICEIFVNEGATVQKGEPLLILEAMKMQNQILASSDATIESILVKTNESVFSDQLLITMKQL